ncbi:hypothetical protein THAOC_01588, partial [Thalassiosira oceanica]
AARGTGEQGNASNEGSTSTSTAGNETARGTAAGGRRNEATTSTADESTSSSGDEAARGSSLGEQGNASTSGAPADIETTRHTAAGEREEATTSTADESSDEPSLAGATLSSGDEATRGTGEHRITGKQHCTVVFSVLIDKPLAIKHHQKSCCLCSRLMTKLIVEGTRAQDITAEDLEHPGVCSVNTTLSPAQAEEPGLGRTRRIPFDRSGDRKVPPRR